MREQDLLVSHPTWLRLCGGTYYSVDDIPLGNFFVQLNPDLTTKEIDHIKSAMKNLASSSTYLQYVVDYRDFLQIIHQANIAMSFFFGFTVIVAMAISFFSLMSSMYTNIYEQSKEIGILRAIGIPYGWMQRIYIYEAFILVLASSLMGMMIGIGVGWTVALQRVLFTALPIPFRFPWELFLIVFFMSILFSIISSWGPITVIMRKPIVSILRMFF